MRRSACSSHCRRKFLEVVEARGGMEAALSDPDGMICAEAVLRFRALYLADEPSADEVDGGLARRERVCAMASGLAGWCLSKLPEAMPGLKAQAALRYCAEHMPKVAECCRDPRVPIDNNELERRCKAFATHVAGVGELEAPEDLGLLVAEPPQPAEQDAPLDVVLLAPDVDGHPALDERPGALAPHLDRLLDLQGDLLGSDYRSGDRLLSWGGVKRAGFLPNTISRRAY